MNGENVKNIATGILVLFLIMYVVLILCLKQQVLISDNWYFLKAFLEAGLIGALADWFAVVAIFKHPLNLPIPHTNIIIKNKEKVVNGLANFVVEHFVTKEQLTNLATTKRDFITGYLLNNQENFIQELKKFDLFNKLKSNLNFSELSEKIQEKLMSFKQKHLKTLVLIQLQKIHSDLNSPTTKNIIENKVRSFFEGETKNANSGNDSFISKAIFTLKKNFGNVAEPKITASILESLNEYLSNSLKDVENSFIYKKIDTELNEFIKNQLEQENLQFLIAQNKLLSEKDFYVYIQQLYSKLCNSEEVFGLILRAIDLIESKKQHIKNYIINTMLQWNEKDFIQHIEDNVGNDLQYIRINGTIIGGFIGLLLFLIEKLFS